jgi:serine/threonine-protein kinase
LLAERPFNPVSAVQAQQRNLGPFRVAKRLTNGSTFEVFLGVQPEPWGLARPVIIKRLRPDQATDRGKAQQLLADYARAKIFDHGMVARVLETGEALDAAYVASELVVGLPLSSLIELSVRRLRPPPAEVAAYVIACAATGLEHIHGQLPAPDGERKTGHRGLSSRKILISFTGEIKIIGAGVQSALAGRMPQASPEERAGQAPTPQSDVFTLGAILFELLGGEPLVPSRVMVTDELVRRRLGEVQAWQTAPDPLREVVARCLAVDVGARFSCAEAVVVGLSSYVTLEDKEPARGLGDWVKELTGDLAMRWESTIARLVERPVTQVMWGATGDGQSGWQSIPSASDLLPNQPRDPSAEPTTGIVRLRPAPFRPAAAKVVGVAALAALVVASAAVILSTRSSEDEPAPSHGSPPPSAATAAPTPPPAEPPPPPPLEAAPVPPAPSPPAPVAAEAEAASAVKARPAPTAKVKRRVRRRPADAKAKPSSAAASRPGKAAARGSTR